MGKNVTIIILVILLLASLGGGGYMLYENSRPRTVTRIEFVNQAPVNETHFFEFARPFGYTLKDAKRAAEKNFRIENLELFYDAELTEPVDLTFKPGNKDYFTKIIIYADKYSNVR